MFEQDDRRTQIAAIFLLVMNLTWGIIQTIAGFALFVRYWDRPHYWYRGSIVTTEAASQRTKLHGGISLGAFIFTTYDLSKDELETSRLIRHEYGHVLQSVVLGPLYLPVIGIPSIVWARFFQAWRDARGIDYYSFYPERWANRWGKPSPQRQTCEVARSVTVIEKEDDTPSSRSA